MVLESSSSLFRKGYLFWDYIDTCTYGHLTEVHLYKSEDGLSIQMQDWMCEKSIKSCVVRKKVVGVSKSSLNIILCPKWQLLAHIKV